MIPDQWQKAKELFDAALKRSPDERLRFLNENCNGDENVRREVESLLANSEDAAGFLEQPVVGEVAQAIIAENCQLADGQNLGRYKIIRQIGAGGMGEVFLAEDTKLERKVALKILPATFAQDAERMRRFVREAKATSALNHPNILTIYEIGESENINYIVAEYIEGETLRERLRREPLNLKAALDVAVQITSAMQAAHGAGVVHRDIKPDNVIIRPDGLAKLLDFGIAKLTEKKTEPIDEEAATAIKDGTSAGMIIGTAAYMSPEQARGKAVDARSDIFSFGLVLYEMLAGRAAFEGESAVDVIGLILHKEPVPLSRQMPDVPHEIERIVGKALRKDCEERYQTAKDLLIDLKDARQELEFQNKLERAAAPRREKDETQIINAATTDAAHPASSAKYIAAQIKTHKLGFVALSVLLLAAAGLGYWYFFSNSPYVKQIESIAVMPFVNESGNADVEYLSDGITETLISSLSQLPKLNVKARSSVFRYKGKETNAQTIGKQLNVQAILTGSVVQRGNILALHIELVDVNNEIALWSGDYNSPMTNLVALQNEITRDVANKLRAKLSGADESRVNKRYTENTEAYELYLKGRFFAGGNITEEGIKKSIEYYQQAIEKDPNYALAYVGLAQSYKRLGHFWGFLPPRETFPKAKAAVIKALEIDETLADAHTALGDYLLSYEWDWSGAEREFKRAIELDPNDASAHWDYGSYFQAMGRLDEAIAERKLCRELDPLSPIATANVGYPYYHARQYDQAIEYYRKALELDPNFSWSYLWIGQAYLEKGMYQEAIAEINKAITLSKDDVRMKATLGYAYAVAGKRGEAQKIISELQEESKKKYVSPYFIAVIYSGLGEKDKAFEWLEKAYLERHPYLTLLKVEPVFDNLRSDPRFTDLVRRVGLPQ